MDQEIKQEVLSAIDIALLSTITTLLALVFGCVYGHEILATSLLLGNLVYILMILYRHRSQALLNKYYRRIFIGFLLINSFCFTIIHVA